MEEKTHPILADGKDLKIRMHHDGPHERHKADAMEKRQRILSWPLEGQDDARVGADGEAEEQLG